MRAITTDVKALVGRLGPVAVKALDLAIGLTMRAGGAEVTSDHLLRAMLDLTDCDFSAALNAAGVSRVDVGARLESHLKRLPTGNKGKPTLSPMLCLMLQDAAALTTDRVRTGHLAAAVIADPGLSAAGVSGLLAALPREPLHLLASRLEDRGEIGRIAAQPAQPVHDGGYAPKPPAQPAPKPAEGAPKPAEAAPKPAEAAAPAAATGEAPAKAAKPRSRPGNAAELVSHFGDRVTGADEGGIVLAAHVNARETSLRILWDTEARVIVLRIAIPSDPPKDEVGAAVALSTLNNAIPQGAFVLDDGRIAFRSHVFLDAQGNAPIETVAFAVRVCEQAAEMLDEA